MTKIDKSLDGLYPYFKSLILKLEKKLVDAHIPIFPFETVRSMERSDELYSQGRKLIKNKWTVIDPKKIVTKAKAGSSFHNFGLAVDFVFDGDNIKPGIQWDWSNRLPWKEFGVIVNTIPGLRWGGNFTSLVDYPHVELATDKNIKDMLAIFQEKGLPELWKELDLELNSNALNLDWSIFFNKMGYSIIDSFIGFNCQVFILNADDIIDPLFGKCDITVTIIQDKTNKSWKLVCKDGTTNKNSSYINTLKQKLMEFFQVINIIDNNVFIVSLKG
jgi:peptidoglycan L-alanyl-D-glutamate endopeptidase CwlK